MALTSLLLGVALKHPAQHTQTHTPALEVRSLYSARALRHARIILQLEMLELRAERLERVRKALEHQLPVERMLRFGVEAPYPDCVKQ